jgi:DNA repair exonuclease SbcCD ATPase subunit
MQTNTNTRAKVTNEQINMAIEQLNSEGIRPTIRAVRERLGAGSPNRIQPLLAAWNDSNKPAEAAQATLDDNDAQVFADILARTRSKAVAVKLEEITELKAQLDEITQTGQQLEDENAGLQEQNEALIAAQAQAQAVAGQQVQRVEQLEFEQQRLQQQSQQQTQELATAQAQLVMQQQQNQQQQQSLEQQAAALDAARQQAAAAQQAAAVAEAKQTAMDAAMDAAAATAAAAAIAAAQRIERLEQQLEQAQKRLDDAQAQRSTDAQSHIKQITQRDEQLNVEHKKNAELMTQIDELSDKLKAAESKNKGA